MRVLLALVVVIGGSVLLAPEARAQCCDQACIAGDPTTGAIVTGATAEQCAVGAAFFCAQAGNADVVEGGCGGG